MTARSDADVESLRKRTYRPLDVFLLVSIIFLFLALSAVVAAVVIAVKRPECFDLQGKDGSGQPAFNVRKVRDRFTKSGSFHFVVHGLGLNL